MKNQLSSLELHYLVKEFQILLNGRIDKIFQADKNEIYLQFYITNIGKKILKITDKLIYLTENKPAIEHPPAFCMYLRKHLNNAKLKKIEQKESERIIEVEFERKETTKKLVVELFGGGNVLLLDEKNTILSATHYGKYKDRDILAKKEYSYPKRKHNFLDLKLEELKEAIKESKKENIVKFLALDLGLGGIYAEEICLIAEVNKDTKTEKINKDWIEKTHKAIKSTTTKKSDSIAIYKDKKQKDVFPFNLEKFKDQEKKEFKTFNLALDDFFSMATTKTKKESPYKKKLLQLKRRIEDQEKAIKKMEKQELEDKQKAENIYSNYALIKEILEELKKAAKKHSLEEIKARLKNHKIIKEFNTKEKKIVVEI